MQPYFHVQLYLSFSINKLHTHLVILEPKNLTL